jgi:DNA replication and repair protein RecF
VVAIDAKPASQLALGAVLRVIWLTPAMDRLWLEGPGDRRQFLDRLVMNLDPAHGPAALAYEKAMRERNRLLRDQLRDPAWFDALEAQMAEHGSAISRGRERALDALSRAQAEGSVEFPVAELGIVRGDGPAWTDAASLREALARGRSGDFAAGRTLTGPHRHDLSAVYAGKGVPAQSCSTGEQKALLISLILASARVLSRENAAPPVLLFDEVAAHLDAGRQAALYGEIRALGAQAWLTGTGPELFEAAGPETDRYNVAEGSGGSSLRRQ